MKKIFKLAAILCLFLAMTRCSENEEVVPELEAPVQVIDSIKVAGDPATSFAMEGNKSNVTSSGFDLKGSLSLETDSGKITILEKAEFTVSKDASGQISSMQGKAPFQMPQVGLFKDFNFNQAVNTSFVYNTGQFFKNNNANFKSLPLRDTSYYFFFNILNFANGSDETLSVKNAQLGVTSYFINLPQEEIIIPTGTFEINTPAGAISVGNDLAIGISAKKAFPFTPKQYADSALNAVIAQKKAFSNLNGFLFLQGEMSLGKKIPMKLNGQAIIDADMQVVFSEGFASGSYTFGLNGGLVFGHDLLDLLPMDFEAELTNVTALFEQSNNGTSTKNLMKFAGDFDDNKWMETMVDAIAKTNISQYIPFSGNEGNMFFSLGEDWEFYVNTFFAFNTPHLGKQPTRKGTLHITSEKLHINGGMALPFIPGELSAAGTFGYDGKIHLQTKAKGDLKIESFVFNSDLTFDIYNDKATLKGNVDVPYGLGKINVNGLIDQKGLTFSGSAGNKAVKFGNVTMPMGQLKIDANIRKENPFFKLSGLMAFPQMDRSLIEVAGGIDSRGIELSGLINTNINILKNGVNARVPLVNMTLTARSWQGVYFNGSVNLPFGIANASATGNLTTNKDYLGFPEILLNLNFKSNPTFKIEGFNFPTSNLNMTVSTRTGVRFNGKVNLGFHFGFVQSSGEITGSKIDFTASYKNSLTLGGRSFASNLTFSAGSHRYPNVASMSGSISTPFGNVNVSGVLGLNGKFACSGSIDGCSTVSNPFRTFSAKYKKKFAFSTNKGIELSATGELCDKKCEEATSCTSKTVSTKIDWQNKSFQVCIPVPLLGDQCF